MTSLLPTALAWDASNDRNPMNTVSAIMYRSKHATAEHPVLAVDGTPIQQWITGLISDHSGHNGTNGLVPAQGWLLDDEHLTIAWKLLEAADESSTVVPLLICPDDMDLSCTVIVVEQVAEADNVVWKRFGLATDFMYGVITSVNWSKSGQNAVFKRQQFDDSVLALKRLTNDVWGRN